MNRKKKVFEVEYLVDFEVFGSDGLQNFSTKNTIKKCCSPCYPILPVKERDHMTTNVHTLQLR